MNESEAAFEAKEYLVAAPKIEELIKALGPNSNTPSEVMEMLHFNVGLAYFLGEKFAEAEAAFTKCVTKFPKGEYASRCHLGVGRACIAQGTPEKKEQAIKSLKLAMADRRFRSEAGLSLGQVFNDLGKREEALAVFRSLMGSDIRSPQQTTAAVEVIGLLADSGNIDDLVRYLDRLTHQAGVRDALAWYTNQVIVRGDEAVSARSYETALAIYQTVPPRSQILETQNLALDAQRKILKLLNDRVAKEKDKPLNQRSNAAELVGNLKPAIELSETALAAIEQKTDLDAALLMRRGRCYYYLDRFEEALVCFRTLRAKYATAADAKPAAYAEIIIISKLKNIPELQTLCNAYIRTYPDAENVEQVATLAGELMVQERKWDEVAKFYQRLETRFPKSESLDRFIFFQAVAHFQDADFAASTPLLEKFLKTYPNSELVETALYYVAMAHFLSNEYKLTLASCNDYLTKFPNGRYAGDMRYRLSFIDFNDKEENQNDKIIRDLEGFLKEHPDDAAAGSMLCLLADTYKKKNDVNSALEALKKAIWTDSPDDVIQYALDSATAILQSKKDWAAIAALHGEFLNRKPESQLALLSATWVAKMKTREGKGAEAAEILANSLKAKMANPANEQVEFLLDELVKSLMPPRKKPAEIDADAVDKQLVEVLKKAIGDEDNPTANARVYYARARLSQLLKRADRADLYLKGIATTNAGDPSVLSPALLAVCGDILLKGGNLDGAQAMYQRLSDRYTDSMFSDAGPVGLGFVALARKQAKEALKIFEDVLANNPGTSRFKETTLGQLQALVETEQYEPAGKLALDMVGDKTFRGETVGKAYLLLAQIYRKQAATASPGDALELLKKAHGTYQRVYVAYQSSPDVCAEAYWQAYETAKELHEDALATETLKTLAKHPKLQNTQRAKDAIKQNP
ncbi:MAG: tetratricopeptide repeat protein [Verrucomicrobia bacterium]|nr:tetratricopeptide repeat protein [Verrucomicrobiota bacterium]